MAVIVPDRGLPYGAWPDRSLPYAFSPVMVAYSLPSFQYKLVVKDTSGAVVAEISDFLALSYSKEENGPGWCRWRVRGDHDVVSAIDHLYQVEVWRRMARYGVDWYRDFSGYYDGEERLHSDQGFFQAECPGDVARLGWRIVAWYAGETNRSAFYSKAAETIMKTLVSYNVGASATTGNGRLLNGTMTGMSVQTDQALGNSLDWFCAYKNVLDELMDLSKVAGGSFDLVKTGDAAWEFRWYTGQRGQDRSGSVTFALGMDNMANMGYRRHRMRERTVAVVAGRGQGGERETVTRTGTNYSAAHHREVFVDARNKRSTAGYQDAGDTRLDELEAREEFVFDALQTEGYLYGRDYCEGGVVGDLVTAVKWFDGSGVTQRIRRVQVTMEQGGGERVEIETETV